MIFFIDDKRQPENHFWNSLQGIATEHQIAMLLEGKKIIIGGVSYRIDFVLEE